MAMKAFAKANRYKGGNGFWYLAAERADLGTEGFGEAEGAAVAKAAAEGGYGRDVPMEYVVLYEGWKRRLRYTCFSNAASVSFMAGKERIYIAT